LRAEKLFFAFFWGVKILKFFDEDQGYGMEIIRIRDPTFFPSRIRTIYIPDPNYLHPVSLILVKEFKYFNPPKNAKKSFSALKNRIRFVHSRSRILMLTFSLPGSGGSKRIQSRIPDPQTL
jgi:hypothetical protein